MLKLSDMSPRSWTLFLVLEDGRELPHWTCGTRQGCRDFRRNMCDPTNGKMPRGLKTRVRKTLDIAAVAS
jgi:hypothetical protein